MDSRPGRCTRHGKTAASPIAGTESRVSNAHHHIQLPTAFAPPRSKGMFKWLAGRRRTSSACRRRRRRRISSPSTTSYRPTDNGYFYRDATRRRATPASPSTRGTSPTRSSTASACPSSTPKVATSKRSSAIFRVVSLYLPSGSSGADRQASKFRFLECSCRISRGCASGARLRHLRRLEHRRTGTSTSRTGASNQKNSGFLPEERAWLDRLFEHAGYVDAFREVNAKAEQYTWWSQPRPGLRQERRLAHRLPGCEQIARRQGAVPRQSTATNGFRITPR